MSNFYQFSSVESSVNDLSLWTTNGTPWHFLSATSRMTRTPHADGKGSCILGTRTRNLNTHVKWIHRGPSTLALPAVTKPHAKRIPREAVEKRERESGWKERTEKTAEGEKGVLYEGHMKRLRERQIVPGAIPSLCPLSLFLFHFYPFFTKTTLIFIRITKNNATHRHPWPVESRPSNADYGGLQVYNWMQEKPPPSSPSQTSYTSRTGIYSRRTRFHEVTKAMSLSSNLGHVTWDTWLKRWRSSIHNRISKSLNSKIRHFRRHRTSFVQAVYSIYLFNNK